MNLDLAARTSRVEPSATVAISNLASELEAEGVDVVDLGHREVRERGIELRPERPGGLGTLAVTWREDLLGPREEGGKGEEEDGEGIDRSASG